MKGHRMNKLWIGGVALLIAAHTAYAQDATKILQEVTKRFNAAKTVKGTIVMSAVAQGKPQSATISMIAKRPNLMSANMSSPASPMGAMRIVCDGKSMYVYMQKMNQYATQPAPSDFSKLMAMSGMDLSKLGDTSKATYKLIRKTTRNGKPVFEIQATPKNPTQQQKGSKTTLFIGQNDYIPVAVVASGPQNNGTITFKNFTYNAPVSASLFKWVPPKGAKLMQTGGGPGGGMRK